MCAARRGLPPARGPPLPACAGVPPRLTGDERSACAAGSPPCAACANPAVVVYALHSLMACIPFLHAVPQRRAHLDLRQVALQQAQQLAPQRLRHIRGRQRARQWRRARRRALPGFLHWTVIGLAPLLRATCGPALRATCGPAPVTRPRAAAALDTLPSPKRNSGLKCTSTGRLSAPGCWVQRSRGASAASGPGLAARRRPPASRARSSGCARARTALGRQVALPPLEGQGPGRPRPRLRPEPTEPGPLAYGHWPSAGSAQPSRRGARPTAAAAPHRRTAAWELGKLRALRPLRPALLGVRVHLRGCCGFRIKLLPIAPLVSPLRGSQRCWSALACVAQAHRRVSMRAIGLPDEALDAAQRARMPLRRGRAQRRPASPLGARVGARALTRDRVWQCITVRLACARRLRKCISRRRRAPIRGGQRTAQCLQRE